MLRVCPMSSEGSHQFLSIDSRKKQVTMYDPSGSGYQTTAHRRPAATPPKMFAFDAIFTQDESLVSSVSKLL